MEECSEAKMFSRQDDQNPSDRIMAAIITYNGQDTIAACLEALRNFCVSGKLQRVLVIDNNSQDGTIKAVDSVPLDNVEIVRLKKNVGMAQACNLALRICLENNCSWILFLDQDSRFDNGSLEILAETALGVMDSKPPIGAVCPKILSASFPEVEHPPLIWINNKFEPFALDGFSGQAAAYSFVDSTITSGTLYNARALSGIGGMRDDFFIDFVDHECHWRLRTSGYKILFQARARLFHNLGKIQFMTKQGLWIEHDPPRYYYMARNMLKWRLETGGIRGGAMFLREFAGHARKLIRFSQNPGKCIYFACKGIVHAISGRSGRL